MVFRSMSRNWLRSEILLLSEVKSKRTQVEVFEVLEVHLGQSGDVSQLVMVLIG